MRVDYNKIYMRVMLSIFVKVKPLKKFKQGGRGGVRRLRTRPSSIILVESKRIDHLATEDERDDGRIDETLNSV